VPIPTAEPGIEPTRGGLQIQAKGDSGDPKGGVSASRVGAGVRGLEGGRCPQVSPGMLELPDPEGPIPGSAAGDTAGVAGGERGFAGGCPHGEVGRMRPGDTAVPFTHRCHPSWPNWVGAGVQGAPQNTAAPPN